MRSVRWLGASVSYVCPALDSSSASLHGIPYVECSGNGIKGVRSLLVSNTCCAVVSAHLLGPVPVPVPVPVPGPVPVPVPVPGPGPGPVGSTHRILYINLH